MRVRPTRRRVSIVAPRRANARWRRAAGARSSRRRVDRVERAQRLVIRLVPHHRLSAVRESINQSLSRSGTASREVDAPRRRAFAMRSRSRSSHPSTRLDSTRDTDTGASVRAELEQTPPPPPRVPPSTEPSTTTRHPRHASTERTRSIDRPTRVPRLATRRRIGRFLPTRAAAAKTILRKTAATPRHQSHFPSSPPSRVSHASSEYRVIGFRNPAPRVPSRHRASTHERFTNRSIIHRVTSIVTRATDGGPRPDTHTHEGV